MSGIDNDLIHRLFDGEVDEAEGEVAREALAQSPDDALRAASLAQMRALLRAEAEATADAADLHGLWPAVAARIERDSGGHAPASLGPASLGPGPLARLRARLGSSMSGHPLGWAAAGVCAVAVAVILGMAISSSLRTSDPGSRPSRAQIPVTDRLDIEQMEFQGRHPDIFQIQDGRRTTTVIWVYPEDEEEDDNGAENGDDPGGTDPI